MKQATDKSRSSTPTRRAAGAGDFPSGGEPWQQLFAVALFASLALLAAIALPMLSGKMYLLGDASSYHLPVRKFYADCLANHDRPEWFPHVFRGYYLHGDGQVGMYHPLHWLLYRFLPLAAAFNLEMLSSYLFLLGGTYLLARRWRLPAAAALFAAMLFTFCGFNLLHLSHVNMVAVIAHLPWVLWMIDLLLAGKDRRHAVAANLGLAAVLGSMLLLGHPQAVVLCAMIALAYTIYLVPRSRGILRWAGLALALVLGLSLGAAQLWPTWELLGVSNRQELTDEFRAMGSMHPANVIQYIGPYLFHYRVIDNELDDNATHELGLYAGAIVPLLLVWTVLRWRDIKAPRGLLWGGAALAVVGLLLAFGRHLPLVHWLVLRTPVLGMFRCPSRFCLLSYAALAALSALAFADLAYVSISKQAIRPARLAWLFLMPALSVAIMLAIAIFGERTSAGFDWRLVSIWPALCGIGLSLGAAIFVIAAAQGEFWGLVGVVLLTAVDLGVYGLTHARQVPPMTYGQILTYAPTIAPDSSMRIEVFPRTNLPTLLDQRLFSGYVGLTPGTPMIEDAEWFGANLERVMQLGSVETVLRDEQPIPVRNPFPRVRLLSDAVLSRDIRRDLPGIDCRKRALVDQPVDLDGGPAGKATLERDRPGRIQIETQSAGRQLLVVGEDYFRGWQARVNDEPTAVVRAYGEYLACVVPPGKNRVIFEFRPRSLLLAQAISLSALGIAIACFAASWFWASRRQRQAPWPSAAV